MSHGGKRGRPPHDDGPRVPFTARLTPPCRAYLDALTFVVGRSASHLVEEAILDYVRRLPAAVREGVERTLAAREGATATEGTGGRDR
jgi:predicted transcriptional regulator